MKKLFLALPLLLLGAAGPAAAHSSLTVSVGPSYGYGYAPPPVIVRPYGHHYWRPRAVVVVPGPAYYPRAYYPPAYYPPAYPYAPPRVVYRPYGY